MSPDTKVKLAELSELSIGQLAAKYESCSARNADRGTGAMSTAELLGRCKPTTKAD